MPKVIVYGADWCHMTHEALEHLQDLDVEFEYIDIDVDREAAKWVAKQNGGKEKKPTVKIDDEVLKTPSAGELDKALRGHRLLK